MKVFPLYEAKPIEQKHAHRNNILDLSSLEKKGLDRFLEVNKASPKSWLLHGWLSCGIKRVSPLPYALFIAEWAQERKGHHPLEVLVALAKLQDGDPRPSFRQMPPSKAALRQMLSECRGLALNNDEDFEVLIETLVDGIVSRDLF